MVNTRMEARCDGLEKIVQEEEHANNRRFLWLEEMIPGLTGVVERLASSYKHQEAQDFVAMNAHKDNRSNAGGSSFGISAKWRKLDIPVFTGDEVYGCTNRLERYFRLREVSEEERMQALMLALEGKALNWFQWWETCNPNPTWEACKDAMVRRFQPTMLQSPFEILIGLCQTGQVGEYIEQFEQYARFMKGMQQDYLVDIFLNGLKEDIKAEVKLYEPHNLAELMMKAQMVEEKVRVTTKGDSLTVQLQSNTYRQLLLTHSYSKEGGNSVGFTNSDRGSGESSGCVNTINSSPAGTQQGGTHLENCPKKNCKIR
ncbi:uncharacterized protein LOC111242018 [Vigna radiata var. radiata]|uniref:Uncharacterized protein LOC111242018 n=1 Tax=Vigna radiata var. radiata TaxID=3916 RepID=A0A3Q0F8S5_VIGRR|nr:uncharacterized protein LOC111242018 [Vigna radiata var. radiata]